METSLSVQNDAILKKAKWWIVSGFACNFVLTVTSRFIGYGALAIVMGFIPLILSTIGCIKLLKHDSPTIKQFSKILLIVLLLIPLLIRICNILFMILKWNNYIIQSSINFSINIICLYVFCMALAVLWKNNSIRSHCMDSIIFLAMVFLFECFTILPSILAMCMGVRDFYGLQYIVIHLKPLLQIYGFWILFKGLSAISIIEEQDIDYRPTKIEIGFLISSGLFTGLFFIFLKLIEMYNA